MPWNNGVYTRGYPSWSNDAAQNLPISSAKFDTEDNDFATGLNNCLTKDGLNGPSGPITWGQTAAIPLSLTRGSDGAVFSAARTGGSNNPGLQVVLADATGIAINLTTAQQLALAINGTNVIAITSTAVTLAQPTTINSSLTMSPGAGLVALTANAVANQFGAIVNGSSTNAQSFGLKVLAGTTAADTAVAIENQAGTAVFFEIFGDGHGTLGPTSATGMSWDLHGALTLAAPASGRALTVNGGNGNYAEAVAGNAASGNSFGLYINAGTTTADVALRVDNQIAGSTWFEIWGDGEIIITAPSAAAKQTTNLYQVGYLDTPLNAQASANYQLIFTDRGKMVEGGNAHTYTIPANASVAFPVGTTILVYSVSGGAISIAITTDTLTWLPSGGTGTRTLANASIATLYKLTATSWLIWGFGLT